MDQAVLDSLMSSVQTIMSPNASQADRQQAHQICEEFKENSTNCIVYGLALAEKDNPHIIRHFGLQLLEHAVKYSWLKLDQQNKDLLKSSALTLIAKGTHGILEEEAHIKDAISKVVVEIIKHEWPAYWPNLMTELVDLCRLGYSQKELVLKVFLRIVEDIVIFQNLNHPRRKDIANALNRHMSDLFEFFINLLQDNTEAEETMLSVGTEEQKMLVHCKLKVSEMTLMTINGYLDWVSMSHITVKDCILLQMLCLLLSHKYLQSQAAECLFTVVSRRGKIEDRIPLLVLFHEGALSTIWEAAITAEKGSTNEHFYKVLQKLCQILVELGRQLCALWGNESCPDVGQPQNFERYLKALLACTQHPSQMLSNYTLTLWSQFLRHVEISNDPYFKAILPQVMETLSKAIYKVGYPSQTNSPSCNYSRLDFDNDEDFALFFSRFRSDCSGVIRLTTLLIPVESFQLASKRLKLLLGKPMENGEESVNSGSPLYLEWEALTVYIECVMSKLNLDNQTEDIMNDGVYLLKNALLYESQDPLILTNLLSCISALFVFLKYTPTSLSDILKKIFSMVLFNFPGQTKSTRCKSVRNLRQHACSVLVKLCIRHPDFMFPVFDELFQHIQQISSDPELLTNMEKHILVEALIIVSNHFNNFDKQSAFLEEVLKPCKEFWSSEEFKIAFGSPDKFMSYIGLDQAAVEPSSADTCGIHRSRISLCLNGILGVIKRSKWPDDVETAKAGGFVTGQSPSGEYIMRNPAAVHITSMLENLLAAIKSMNMLHCEECIKLRHPDFTKAYDLPDTDLHILLGTTTTSSDNMNSLPCSQPLKRMKHFLSIHYDVCGHILGNSALSLGHDFYSIPNLSQTIVQTALSYLDILPDYRIRSLIRIVLKPIILHCPPEFYTSVVLPLLSHVCPFMLTHLSAKWQVIQQRSAEKREEDEEETQEVLEEQFTRQLTRDYLELLGVICFSIKGSDIKEEMEDDDDIPHQPQAKEIGNLGKLCMSYDNICEALVLTVFNGLNWLDTIACLRCSTMAMPLLKQLVIEKQVPENAICHIYERILTALQTHGYHDASQAALLLLGLQTYELLLPRYPGLRSIMLLIPKCSETALKAFEDKLMNSQQNMKTADKKKKDSYKKLVSEIIGKYIGQRFKREIRYQTLPNMFLRQKLPKPQLDDIENTDIGICGLFEPDPS